VWGTVAIVLGLAWLVWAEAGHMATEADVRDARATEEARVLATTVEWLRTVMHDHVCLSCADAGITQRCIVWPDGRVWRDPVILAESVERDAAFEAPFTRDGAVPAPAVLVERPAWLDVRHDTTRQMRITGRAAHCVAHALHGDGR
jgi:hypothetical protein